MRIPCDDGGYLEFQRSKKAHYVHVLVGTRNPKNPLQLLVNSAEVPLEQLLKGVQSVAGPIRLDQEGQENEQDNSSNNSDNQKQNSEE